MFQSAREGRGRRAGRSAAALALGLLGGAGAAVALPASQPAVAQAGAAQPVPHVFAQSEPELYDEAIDAYTVQGGSVSLREARAMAVERFGGRVVSAETKVRGGNRVHEIRIIDDENRVRTVRIDARSGEFR